jgi:hypothetical protein
VVVQTTHSRRTKIVAKKYIKALVAQIFNEGLYFLTLCSWFFVVIGLSAMVGMCCGRDLISMVCSVLFHRIWFMWLHLWNGLEKWGY